MRAGLDGLLVDDGEEDGGGEVGRGVQAKRCLIRRKLWAKVEARSTDMGRSGGAMVVGSRGELVKELSACGLEYQGSERYTN